mmetsp:Transcript_46125/g.144679  ORF Transcript_46125/g.144679 Transcript_46125/m.144679 type:complete len:265 (+) Transcript_46125:1076-1870(+)
MTADVSNEVLWMQKILRHCLHFSWPCRCEHQSLPVGPDLTDDGADLRLESHIQHPVCFIQDKVCYPSQICRSGFKEIYEAPRGSNTDVDSSSQRPCLRSLRRSSKHASTPKPRAPSKLVSNILDLLSQLARGSQDEYNGSIPWSQGRLCVNVYDCWKQKRESLSRSCFSNADTIPAGQCNRPSDRLNWCGLYEAFLCYLSQHILWEPPLLEGQDRPWCILPLHPDFETLCDALNLLRTQCSNLGMFLVEVLLEHGKVPFLPILL